MQQLERSLLDRVDEDMRGAWPSEVDALQGMQPRQRETQGFLRGVEDGVLLRMRLDLGLVA